MAEHTVIAMQPGGLVKSLPSKPPRDYLLASLFNLLVLGNPCCLSFVALVYSVKSRDQKLVGDMNSALAYANTSKKLNIAAIILNVLVIIIAIIICFVYLIPSLKVWQKEQYSP
ncbi:interferon-induced transmembrane protein 3-like [Macrotis lagotis]|uniref:interferon-induced transmembrane protein 3-like n=1 Tax=Macrotis lagotis TaxID=92651 RepID=UPI003D69829E